MSASRRCQGAGGYDIEVGPSFDSEARNHVQGESDRDDGVAAILAREQSAPGVENASSVCTASAGDIAIAAANVLGAIASCA